MEREIESSGTSDGGESESNVTASVVGVFRGRGEHVCGEDDGESERVTGSRNGLSLYRLNELATKRY